MTNSRRKGKVGELEWRDMLRSHGWTDARRGQQYSGTETSADVVDGPEGWHCEVKRVQALNIEQAMAQAAADAGNQRPYVAHRKNGKPWLVTLRADDFLTLLKP